jgi:fructokinase
MQQDIICFGEILWDILPSGAMPGGAPMNVAFHLKQLGLSPAIITRIGNDAWGEKLIQLLTEQDLSTAHIQTDKQYSTGLVNAETKENNEVVYDIRYPAAWDFIEASKEAEVAVQNAGYFVFGSLAARSDKSRTTLLQLLPAANIKVLDINLRPPHFSKEFILQLLTQADILKLNEHEIKLISGWLNSYSDIHDQLKAIEEKFDLHAVLVTMGNAGAILSQNGKLIKHKGYRVKVADTIGSGDAFLAAFLSQTISGSSAEDALAFANALGAFVASMTGAWPGYKVADILQLMKEEQG